MNAAWALAVLLVAPPAQEPEAAPALRGCELHFEGNASVAEQELRQAAEAELANLEPRGYRRAEIDDAAFAMENYYHGRGFPFARVQWRYEPRDSILHATFLVEEGPRTRLSEARFTGSRVFTEETLRVFLLPAPPGSGAGEPWYVESRVRAAPAGIRAAYLAQGYLDAQVERPEVRFSEGRGQAFVLVRVVEGVQYLLRGVRFQGTAAFSETELQLLARPFLDLPFFPRRVVELRAKLLEAYAERGYADAGLEVARSMDGSDGAVRLVLTVTEGPQVRIAAVEVRGNARTRARFIESRLKLAPGQLYNRRLENESFRELYRTGLFSRVRLFLEGAGPQRVLVVEVEEVPAKELIIEPGYGSYEKLRLELGARERNLFGTGRALRGEIELSLVGEAATIGFTDPWLFGSAVELDVPIFYRRRQQPSFILEERGASALFKRQFSRPFSVSAEYQIKRSGATGVDAGSGGAVPLDNLRVASVALEPRWDTRDDPFNPSSGSLHSLRLQHGTQLLASELEFLRAEARLSWFWPLDSAGASILGAAWRSGVIVPVGGTDAIPLQERFFLGGQDTLRGLEEGELGPLGSRGNPLGGEVFSLFNLELRRRLSGSLWGALFLDYGNVGLETGDYLDDFRWSPGAGLRYLLPVGAVRLDAGFNPDRRPGEESYQVFVSVGMAF